MAEDKHLPAEQTEFKALHPLKSYNPKEVINQYLEGKNSTEIAKEIGVSKQAISLWLLKHAEKDWHQAQVAKAISLRDEAEDAMEHAADALDLARARERLKSAQWSLERLLRRIYGQDVPQDVAGKVSININLGGGATQQNGVVIEGNSGKPVDAADS